MAGWRAWAGVAVVLGAALAVIAGALEIPAARAAEVVESGEMEIGASAAEAVEEAAAALKEGRFDAAASMYAALAAAGGGAEARYWEGLARYEAGDLRGARRAMEEVLKAKPESLSAMNLYGLILVDGGAVEEGIRWLTKVRDQAMAKNDAISQAKAMVNLGLAELDRGNAAAAASLLQHAKEIAGRAGSQPLLDAANAGPENASDSGSGPSPLSNLCVACSLSCRSVINPNRR